MAIYPNRNLNREELIEIHKVCSEFEERWQSDLPLTIEVLIEMHPAVPRQALLESLLRSELELRGASQSPLVLSEGLARFPKDAEVVQVAFSPSIETSNPAESNIAASNKQDTTVAITQGDTPPTGHDEIIPRVLGEYEIIDEYARGGMGIIYRARHRKLDRIVALKVILAGQWATDLELARFKTEAKAIAALEHPNIVVLYEAGASDGYHFFSMPMIEGNNLAEVIRDRPLPAREAAEITRQIALAVEYAHHRGIIHRDLKPRNILLDENRKALVSDFGLAKIVKEEASISKSNDVSMTGTVVGTPAYMAPEQAAGAPTKASDIYSIGAILYTILTGRPPFQAATPLETLFQVRNDEPVAPRQLNALIPRDLETIAIKCLSKSPEARYPTAGELAGDLERYLAGKPILARPVSRFEHFVRWTRRQPVVASLAAAVFASLVAGIAVSLWFNAIARRNEQAALKNFEFATATVKKYLSDVASSPELKEKGLETLRKNLLSTAQDFYLKLESGPIRSQAIDERLADSQLNLAMISNELGDLDDSQQHYDHAQAAYKSLSDLFPENTEFPRKLIQSLRGQALVLSKQNQLLEAENQFIKAIEESRLLYDKTKQRTDQLNLIATLGELGILYVDSARPSDEKKVYDEVEQQCDEMRRYIGDISLPEDAELLITTLDRLALNQQARGRFADSEKWFLTIVDVAKSQLNRDGRNPFFQFSVARACKNLMMVCSRTERFVEAKEYYDQSIAIYEQLMREHPLVIAYMDGCAITQLNLGSVESARRNYLSAATAFRAGIGLQETIISLQPRNFDFRLGMGVFCSGLANALTRMGEHKDAEEALRKGAESLAEAQRIQPNATNSLFLVGLISNNLGALYRDQRRFAEAKSAFQQSCDSSKRLVEIAPENVSNVRLCASNYSNLASTCSRLKEVESGINAAEESNRLTEELLSGNPGNSDYLNIVVNNYNTLAEIYLDVNRLEESESSAAKSRDILSKLIATADAGDRFQAMFSIANYNLGIVALRRRQFDIAIDCFNQALAACKVEMKLREKESTDASRRIREVAIQAYREKARSLRLLDRRPDALAECELGVELGQGIDTDELQALICRIQIEQGNYSQIQGKIEELRSKDSSKLNFDGLVDMAACCILLMDNSNGSLRIALESAMKEYLKHASTRDSIRFTMLKEDSAFAAVADWSEYTRP